MSLTPFFVLLKKEIFSLAISPFVYVLLGVWFLLNSLLLNVSLGTQYVQADLALLPGYLFGSGLLVWLLLPVFPPLLCLRLFAEEHRTGTLEPLLTAPISDVQVVLAKYFAPCLFFLLFWGGLMFLFVILSFFGAPLSWPQIIGGFMGSCLLSFLFIATSLFASSWSGNLVLACGGGAAINYCLLFLPALFEYDSGFVGRVARNAHLPNMIADSFSTALIDSYSLSFFFFLIILFLFLTWMRLVSRRWVP